MKLRRIFHPTDFSPAADEALRVAIRLALAASAELIVGHVVYGGADYWDVDTQEDDADLRIRMRERVAKELTRLDPELRRTLHISYSVIRHAKPGRGIVRFLESRDIDVVVMGTHGRRGVRRFLLGSVAFDVLHAATRDVLLVPSGTEEHLVGRILVPVDFHDRAPAQVRAAADLAGTLNVPLDLFFVLDVQQRVHYEPTSFLSMDVGSLNEVAMDKLDELTVPLDAELVVTTHVDSGRPAAEILHQIADRGAGMVVMAASSMSPEEHVRMFPYDRDLGEALRWAIGRVCERVASHADVPVWIMKRFEGEDAPPIAEPLKRRTAILGGVS